MQLKKFLNILSSNFFFSVERVVQVTQVSLDARSNNLNFVISDHSFNFVVEAMLTVLKICGW